MKQKLDSAYAPDKNSRNAKAKVVVALSGGIDSFVTAYLLKIQKYDLLAVTVAIGWEEFSGDPSQKLACFIDPERMTAIKEFCNSLNIPHQFIKASEEFEDGVVEGWIANRATGTLASPCWNCHELRMRMLHQKMKQLGAETLATGHFAKLFHQEVHGTVYVHTSNDDAHDQSVLLARLPHEILSSLSLPLSDLTKKEVLKLAENFGLEFKDKKLKMHQCFQMDQTLQDYLLSKVPAKYSQHGEFSNSDGTSSFGEHNGIIAHGYGEPMPSNTPNKKSEYYVSRYLPQEKKIEVQTDEFFMRNKVMLVKCEISEDTSLAEPMKGVVRLDETTHVDCWVYPKNLKAVLIEWDEPHKVLEGDILAVFRKKGKNAKVYLSGKVKLLPQEVVEEEGEKQRVKKVDYSRDL